MKLLLERGARLDATQCDGARAIHMASGNNRHEVVRYLVQEAGENVDVIQSYFHRVFDNLLLFK